ncbi:Hypothetical predicted protein [Paramuricea clavata]|uniref:Uncharacterized protein n=1 Tax=Paramuricea clavata TaxID=317549 RepID=A0A7D9JF43_PARCT|nr:Hypothetical predicted protein [Paramuricea clavata]
MLRWHAHHDVDLLREVVAVRPKSANDWNTIAANLHNAWGEEETQRSPIKGRSCKEHFGVLLAHHKAGNASALKKLQFTHTASDDVVAIELHRKKFIQCCSATEGARIQE